jgi:hypothetical protein
MPGAGGMFAKMRHNTVAAGGANGKDADSNGGPSRGRKPFKRQGSTLKNSFSAENFLDKNFKAH